MTLQCEFKKLIEHISDDEELNELYTIIKTCDELKSNLNERPSDDICFTSKITITCSLDSQNIFIPKIDQNFLTHLKNEIEGLVDPKDIQQILLCLKIFNPELKTNYI
jgi:hypothetical protein